MSAHYRQAGRAVMVDPGYAVIEVRRAPDCNICPATAQCYPKWRPDGRYLARI